MKKHIFNFASILLVAVMLVVVGCKKDNDSDASNPNTPVPDPGGTITANISESVFITISGDIGGTIGWTAPDNFKLSSDKGKVSICDIGVMKGLGNIINIPQTGYSEALTNSQVVAFQQEHGYMIKFERSELSIPPVFVRLYVEEPIINVMNEIIGAKVKYQYPFKPTMLSFSVDTLIFPGNGGTKTLNITTNATDWTYSTSNSWINITRENNTLSVAIAANETFAKTGKIIIRANEQQQIIIVKQSSSVLDTTAPYEIGDFFCEDGNTGVVYKISNDGYSGMIVSLIETQSQWTTTYVAANCSDFNDGKNNMSNIQQLPNWESEYPAFKWCNDFNIDNNSDNDWYFPAINELAELYAGFCGLSEYPEYEHNASIIYKEARDKFNETLTSNGGTLISENYYWCSSVSYDDYTWCMNFRTGHQEYNYGGSYSYRVRAIRAF